MRGSSSRMCSWKVTCCRHGGSSGSSSSNAVDTHDDLNTAIWASANPPTPAAVSSSSSGASESCGSSRSSSRAAARVFCSVKEQLQELGLQQ